MHTFIDFVPSYIQKTGAYRILLLCFFPRNRSVEELLFSSNDYILRAKAGYAGIHCFLCIEKVNTVTSKLQRCYLEVLTFIPCFHYHTIITTGITIGRLCVCCIKYFNTFTERSAFIWSESIFPTLLIVENTVFFITRRVSCISSWDSLK